MTNHVQRAVYAAKMKNLKNIRPEDYALSIWMMFIAADLLVQSSMEIQEMLMANEQFVHQDKMHIKAIINHANKFVKDVDQSCTERFAEKFADYTGECHTLLRSYMQNQMSAMDDIWAEPKNK